MYFSLHLKKDADFPTFGQHDCVILVLGECVIRLKSTTVASQLLALLMEQLLVMWTDKLVNPWETGVTWGTPYLSIVLQKYHSRGSSLPHTQLSQTTLFVHKLWPSAFILRAVLSVPKPKTTWKRSWAWNIAPNAPFLHTSEHIVSICVFG